MTYPLPYWLQAPLAFLAGTAALLQLLLVASSLSFEFGDSTALHTTVFGCFVGGAAFGALLVGARADASTRPLRWCGLLQIGLALYSFALPTLRGLLGESMGLGATGLALAAFPGLLTGGTVAILTRAGSNTTDRAASAAGVVFGAMVLGGAIALPLVAALGTNAGVAGSALHLLAGLAAWGLSSVVGARDTFSSTSANAVASDLRTPWFGGGGLSSIAAMLALGIALPLQRYGWQRALPDAGESFFLHLIGLGVGCCMGAVLVYSGSNARRILARTMVMATVVVLGPLLLAGGLLGGDGLGALLAVPGAWGIGLAFPAVLRVALTDRAAIGRQSGALLATFACGWALSQLFIVAPVLAAGGAGGMIFAAGVLLVVGGTWCAFARGLRDWIPAGVMAVLAVLVLLMGGAALDSVGASRSKSKREATIRTVEERSTADARYEMVEDLQTGVRALFRDGVRDPAPDRYVDGYRTIAHLPMLLHEFPKRVLVANFGSGTVAGAAAEHAEAETIDALDDDEVVFEFASGFAEQNRDALEKPTVIEAAAPLRRALRLRKASYNVLVLEPRSAVGVRGALVYTEEFYKLGRNALSQDGILCQRLPTETWNVAALKSAVRAATEVFESVSLWEFEDGLYLVACESAPALKPKKLLVRASKVAQDLQRARISDAAHLLAGYVCEGADFAADAEPFRDGGRGDEPAPVAGKWRVEIAQRASRTGPVWAEKAYETLPAAADRSARLRALLASRRATSTDLYTLADESRGDLRARAAAETRHYRELMAKNDWAAAARLSWVRDRNAALRNLAAAMEDPARRRFYEILILRGGGLPEEASLARLAESLDGAEARFVRNRLHALRGEPNESGEESLPNVALPDPTPALVSGEVDSVREHLLDAECAGLVGKFDKAAWAWWDKQPDKADAVLLLDGAQWRHSLRAARRVAGQNRPRDLIVLAPLFAAAHPTDATWQRLCKDRRSDVRVAAAEAARAHGGRAHVAALVELCKDPSREVRTGAYLSLRGVLGEGVSEAGYDPADPSPEAIASLEALGAEDKQPAAPDK